MSVAAIFAALELIGPAVKLVGSTYTALAPMFKDLLGKLMNHPEATPEQVAAARAMLDMSIDEANARLQELRPIA
jgi:hypothetical protein